MSLSTVDKPELIAKHRRHEKDTGSTEVQVTLLTTRIQNLTGHFKTNAKDFHSRYGLEQLVSRRRKLLKYIKRTQQQRYYTLIEQLGLRDSY